jgi:hypothetical protein
MTHTSLASLLTVTALFVTGCGGSTPSGYPTSPPPPPGSGHRAIQILGIVTDAVSRTELAGARVEIVNGPSAGLFAVSDSKGRVSLIGQFTGVLTFRATKEGYRAASQTLDADTLCSGCQAQLSFVMLSAAIFSFDPGTYILTFIADSTCIGLPVELRTRRYTATITYSVYQGGWYDVRVPGMLYEHGWFMVQIVGNELLTDDDSYPTLFEPVSQSTYLGIDFAFRKVFEASGSTLSVRFPGTFEYCTFTSGSLDPRFWFCESAPQPLLAHDRCDAEHHQMIFVRQE